MARDVKQLRVVASESAASGKYKRALAAYLELETLEPRDAQWPKRSGEIYRRLNRDKDAIEAFSRAADRYAQGGFLVQAIAVCKLILQIDPSDDTALQRIAAMSEQIGAGPTRASVVAENNPNLADITAVVALRRSSPSITGTIPPNSEELQRARQSTHAPMGGGPLPGSESRSAAIPIKAEPEPARHSRALTAQPAAPVVRQSTPAGSPRPAGPAGQDDVFEAYGRAPSAAVGSAQAAVHDGTRSVQSRTANTAAAPKPRTRSKPITLSPNQGIDSIELKTEMPAAFERNENSGVYVIPIDDDEFLGEQTTSVRSSVPQIVVEEATSSPIEVDAVTIDEPTELELEDIEEIPLPEPRALGQAAAQALAATPLFAGLTQEALESFVSELQLVHLVAGDVLFREGDPGDALYVIVEGEVVVETEGPPRVELVRLGPGEFIGEVALMTDQPRSATVAAVEDSELLRIDRLTLARVLAEHGEVLAAVLRFVRDRLVDRWTRTSPLFRPFDTNERQSLAAKFRFLEIDASSTLFTAGSRPDGLYIVLAGQFVVRRSGVPVATLGPGNLIGETALLSGAAIQSEIVSLGKSLALCLPAREFREVIMTHPHVLEYIGEQAEQSRKLQIL